MEIEQIVVSANTALSTAAQSILACRAARESRDRLTLEALRQNRGNISKVTWDHEYESGDEGDFFNFATDVVLHLADGSEIVLDREITFHDFRESETDISIGGRSLRDIAEELEMADSSLTEESAEVRAMANALGMAEECTSEFLALLSHYIYSHLDGVEIHLQTAPTG